MPEDRANIIFKILLFIFLKKNTSDEPKVVIKNVNKVEIIVKINGLIFSK